MNGLVLLRRFLPGFRRRRRQFLANAGRLLDIDDYVDGFLVVVDLGFGLELWECSGHDVLVEPEWFTLRDARLVTDHDDAELAVAEAERRGWSLQHVSIKF